MMKKFKKLMLFKLLIQGYQLEKLTITQKLMKLKKNTDHEPSHNQKKKLMIQPQKILL